MSIIDEMLKLGVNQGIQNEDETEQAITELSEIDASLISDCFERDARRYSRNISLE